MPTPSDSGGSLVANGEAWAVDRQAGGAATLAVAVTPGVKVLDAKDPGGSAIRFLTQHADVFGVASAADLEVVAADAFRGGVDVRVRQRLAGIPVAARGAVVSFASDGSVALVSSALGPPPALGSMRALRPRMEAEADARREFVRRFPSDGVPRIVEAELQWSSDFGAPMRQFVFLVQGRKEVLTIAARADGAGILWASEPSSRAVGTGEAYSSPTMRTFPVEQVGPKYTMTRKQSRSPGYVQRIEVLDFEDYPIEATSLTGPWALSQEKSKDFVESYTNAVRVDEWFRSRFQHTGAPDAELEIATDAEPCGQASAWRGHPARIKLGNCPGDDQERLVWNVAARSYEYVPAPEHRYSGDVFTVAHEFAHLVIWRTANLQPRGEPGALDESFADTFAWMFMKQAGRAVPWQPVASDPSPLVTRDPSNPSSSAVQQQGPRRYSNRYTGSGDDGGRHINSLIASHALYLMLTGGRHADTHVGVPTTLTWSEAEEMYFRLLRIHLTGSDTFRQAATELVEIATRFGARKREAVYCAWRAVEVFEPGDDATIGKGASCVAACGAAAGGDAGVCPSDASAAPAPTGTPDPKPPAPINCEDLEDGFYCDPITSPYAAVQCIGHLRSGIQCPTGKRCDPSHDGELIWANFCK